MIGEDLLAMFRQRKLIVAGPDEWHLILGHLQRSSLGFVLDCGRSVPLIPRLFFLMPDGRYRSDFHFVDDRSGATLFVSRGFYCPKGSGILMPRGTL